MRGPGCAQSPSPRPSARGSHRPRVVGDRYLLTRRRGIPCRRIHLRSGGRPSDRRNNSNFPASPGGLAMCGSAGVPTPRIPHVDSSRDRGWGFEVFRCALKGGATSPVRLGSLPPRRWRGGDVAPSSVDSPGGVLHGVCLHTSVPPHTVAPQRRPPRAALNPWRSPRRKPAPGTDPPPVPPLPGAPPRPPSGRPRGHPPAPGSPGACGSTASGRGGWRCSAAS